MRNYKRIRLVILLLVIVSPLLLHLYLTKRFALYEKLITDYECQSENCSGDFNGDGIQGVVQIIRSALIENGDGAYLSVIDGNQEILRLKYKFIDRTLRTHIAILRDKKGDKLVIFDGAERSSQPTRAVYQYNGGKMVKSYPTALERDVISAMSSQDDAGTWNIWVAYRIFSSWVYIAYYFCLILIFFLIWRKRNYPPADADQLRR